MTTEALTDRADAVGTPDLPRASTTSLQVGAWTLVSRVCGLIRVAVTGAVLGSTFFANIFQSTNLVPNITFEVVAGSLLTTLLVPALVEALDRAGVGRAKEVVGGFLGVIVLGLIAAGILLLAAGPLIIRLLTLGVTGSAAAAAARHQAWILLFLVIPQIALYGVVAVSVAAQNARQRFALAAAAPAVENIGLIVTMLLVARRFGTGNDSQSVQGGEIFTLGLGATLSVLAHATIQLTGAARAGISVWPRWGLRDPDVRRVLRRTIPSIGTGALTAAWVFALTVGAGVVPGGVVAFQMSFNFYNLPIAFGARAVGTTILPRLSQLGARSDDAAFSRAYEEGLTTSWFLAAPAGLAVVFLAHPLARALAFGQLSNPRGTHLLSLAMASLGFALIGGATLEIARQASYARFDAVSPMRASILRISLTLVGVVVAIFALRDSAVSLVAIGAAMTAGDVVAAVYLHRAAVRGLPTHSRRLLTRLAQILAVSAAMLVPAVAASTLVPRVIPGRVGLLAGVFVGTASGLAVYLLVHHLLGSPELVLFGFRRQPYGRTGALLQEYSGEPPASHAGKPPRSRLRPTGDRWLVVAAFAASLLLGAAGGVAGPVVALGAVAAVVFVVVARRPIWAAYIYLAALPLITGIGRGVVVPLLRPQEVLQLFLSLAVAAGWYVRFLRGGTARFRITRLDKAFIWMAVLASFWPLVWMIMRNQQPSKADLLATVPLWKFLGLIALFRIVVRTAQQVRRCLLIVLIGAAVLALIALGQSLGLPGLNQFLTRYYSDTEVPHTGRGTATLSNSIAVGDYLAYALALLLVWRKRLQARRAVFVSVAVVLAAGAVGTGQFSAWLAVIIVVIAVTSTDRWLQRSYTKIAPLVVVAIVAAWPVLLRRLSELSTGHIPYSWTVRLDNLRTFYLPHLGGFGFVFGVRPNTILDAPETWRDKIYLESGHLWLLWVGGIPLLLAYSWFLYVALQRTRALGKTRNDDVGAAARACWAGLCAMGILTVFDMHLTYRGAADLLFILLALGMNRQVPWNADPQEGSLGNRDCGAYERTTQHHDARPVLGSALATPGR